MHFHISCPLITNSYWENTLYINDVVWPRRVKVGNTNDSSLISRIFGVSGLKFAKIAIFGIALQFELWYCKNDLNGPLISNFNFETILTCLLFFKVVKVNCEWLLIKQKPYINQPNFVIILGNEKCYPFSHLFNQKLNYWRLHKHHLNSVTYHLII
jgi:hypothetical protein